MAVVKAIVEESSTVAWSPLKMMPNAVATGTMEGGGGGFDDYGGTLTLHSFDAGSSDLACRKMGSIKTSARFSSLAWGRAGASAGRSYGLIAGGLSDGVVEIFDPSKIIQRTEGTSVATVKQHTGAIKSVHFNGNPGSTHLFAAGSSDGGVSIVNLQRPDAPSVATPGASGGSQGTAEITSVAWNPSVAHILASADASGTAVVWNLKEERPWAQLRDPQRNPISSVAWHPTEGVYIVTATEDDARPVLKVWDLRANTSAPLVEFRGHNR
ncbi:sec31, partial [Symbiodinium sp. KB8]